MTLIPHYNKDERSEKLLIRCLSAIRKTDPRQLHHTVIIDDASPRPFESFSKVLMKDFPGIKVFLKDVNTSYSDVINLGLDYAQSLSYDILLTLNNDVEILTPYASIVSDFFTKIPDLMVLGGVLLYPTGRIQSAGFYCDMSSDSWGFMEYEKNMHYGTDTPAALKGTRFVEGVTGAMQFIRVKEAIDVGAYSPRFKMAYEDVEFCIRAWQNNYKVLFSHQIKAIHSESSTRGYLIGPKELQSIKEVQGLISTLDIQKLKNKVQEANSLYRSQSF